MGFTDFTPAFVDQVSPYENHLTVCLIIVHPFYDPDQSKEIMTLKIGTVHISSLFGLYILVLGILG